MPQSLRGRATRPANLLLALVLVLEGGTTLYVGNKVVYHTVCEYKELYTDSDKRYRWYVRGAYRCPPYVRHYNLE